MKTRRSRILALSVLGLVLVIGSAGMGHGQHEPDPNSPRFLAVTALMEFIQSIYQMYFAVSIRTFTNSAPATLRERQKMICSSLH